jgi:hypothetical protein
LKLALWITVGIAALIIAALAGLMMLPVLTAEKIGWDTPLSRDDALRRLDITYSFPQSAHDIYLHQRREGTQQNFLYVRFTVDPSEVERHIDETTSAYRHTFPDEHAHRVSLPAGSSPSVGWLPPPPRWWQASHIKHGYLIRFTQEFGPVFWFDADHNVLYHYEQS